MRSRFLALFASLLLPSERPTWHRTLGLIDLG
jgi:hypothetical protein